jgi:plastocyanin
MEGYMVRSVAVLVVAGGLLAGTAGAAEHFVTVLSNSYSPAVVFIQPGDTVTWTYSAGAMGHQVRADDDSYSNPVAPAPWSFSHVFPAAMTSRYYCGPHGGPGGVGMSGVVVVEGRNAAASDIAYTLSAWDFSSRTSPGNNGPGTLPFHRTSTSGIETWIAGVRLPSGALITGLEVSGCDTGTGSLTVTLRECTDPDGACTTLAAVTPAGIPPCGFSSAPVSAVNVDNLDKSYVVEALVGPSQSLRNVRVFYRKVVSPAPATATFVDVPTNDPRFRFVEALAAAGITGGCGGGQYCPDAAVTRGQMAVFLSVALGLYWPN